MRGVAASTGPIGSIALIALAGFVLVACVGTSIAAQYRRAHPGCGGEVTVTHRPGTEVRDVVGCGSRGTVHRECTLGANPTCMYAVSTHARRQAAFELGCAEEDLEETVIGDGRVGFQGCGGRVAFVQRGDRWLSSRSSAAEGR